MNIIGMTVPDLSGNENVEQIVANNNGTLVDFYSMKMEDLQIIAKYRMLPVPTILILNGTQVVGRIVKNIPTADQFERLLEKYESFDV